MFFQNLSQCFQNYLILIRISIIYLWTSCNSAFTCAFLLHKFSVVLRIRNCLEINRFLSGTELYDEALKYGETDSILLRLGNALNEVGSFYLNRARTMLGDSSIFDTCTKAESCLKRALDIFEKIRNDGNTALLYTNIGHLHRLLAHANSPAERSEITNMEKVRIFIKVQVEQEFFNCRVPNAILSIHIFVSLVTFC